MPRPATFPLLFGAVFCIGCGGSTSATVADAPRRAAVDPWPAFAQGVRKETDPASVRRVMGQLGADLALNPAAEQPVAPTPAEDAALAAAVELAPEDAAEVRSGAYTPLDAAYLADALYLRDAARSLEVGALPPRQQADAAFQWVLRHVELRPWVLDTGRGYLIPALPSTAVLRRGSGSGLERAYIFLGLLHQLGLDGVLVGGPDAAGRPAAELFDPNAPTFPRGPFWAVGVRANGDLALFDPWRGEAVPGTLAEIRANPALFDPWRNEGWDVPAADVTGATATLAAPLSALAPRMGLLEEKLRAESPVRLRFDPTAAQARFAESKLPGVRFWAPRDGFGLLRTSASFVPSDEGGRDTAPTGGRLFDRYRIALFPRALFTTPRELASAEARERLVAAVADTFSRAFFTAPSPRELVQRGAGFEAMPALVARRAEFQAMAERLRTDRQKEELQRDWVTGANAVYDRLGRARLDEAVDPGAAGEARAAVDAFWKNRSQGAQALIDAALAEPGVAEATYLLALAKHEQATRAQRRIDALEAEWAKSGGKPRSPAQERGREQTRDKAQDAWGDAAEWWGRYEPFAAEQERTYPGRAGQATRLAAAVRR